MPKQQPRTFAIIGLGQIGGHLARLSLEKGYQVVGVDKAALDPDLLGSGLRAVSSVAELRDALDPPRRVLMYVPAGPTVDDLLEELAYVLAEGDVVADGGNSYWGDSLRRHARLKQKGIGFVDAGTSGGVPGARSGACFMVGGDSEAIAIVEPILQDLAVDGGYLHVGGPGTGHFVKLVHNGIEFGMLQAIGEGVDLLEQFRDPLPVAEILRCWSHGSVIRSWLIELMEAGYRSSGLDQVPPFVEDTGEVNWLLEDALKMEVPIPIIAQSVMQLFASRDSRQNWARAIAMMRHRFGGHPYGPNSNIASERQTARVGGFPIRKEKRRGDL